MCEIPQKIHIYFTVEYSQNNLTDNAIYTIFLFFLLSVYVRIFCVSLSQMNAVHFYESSSFC